jgi:fluoride exporter
MDAMVPFVIFVGAGLGGLSRYAIGSWIQTATGQEFPWGTLLINVTGSLLLTFVYGYLDATMRPPEWRAFLGIGFLGGYTTFSAFSYETIRLLQDGSWTRAMTYVVTSVLLSVSAAFVGVRLASAFLRRG